MNNVLVAYFSASGTTNKVATLLADSISADIHEIIPETPYTKEDLDWDDENSRSSIEKNDRSSRPALANKVENINDYDTIFVGFPIWSYTCPTIVNTFLEQQDLSGKTIIPFVTSESDGFGETNKDLALSCKGAELKPGTRLDGSITSEELKAWAESYK